jgi:hypothetical protein
MPSGHSCVMRHWGAATTTHARCTGVFLGLGLVCLCVGGGQLLRHTRRAQVCVYGVRHWGTAIMRHARHTGV